MTYAEVYAWLEGHDQVRAAELAKYAGCNRNRANNLLLAMERSGFLTSEIEINGALWVSAFRRINEAKRS